MSASDASYKREPQQIHNLQRWGKIVSNQLCHGHRVTANPMSVWPYIAPVDFHSSVNKYLKYWNEFEEWPASNSLNFADFSFLECNCPDLGHGFEKITKLP
jgi:hypothetical protein